MKPNRILLIHTAFIGDVILLTPLIRAIKQSFPESYLGVILIPIAKEILRNNPNIDELIVFNKRKNKFFELIKKIIMVRKRKFDTAILPHSSLTTAVIPFLGNVKTRIGFDRWTTQKLLTHKVRFRKNILRIEKNLDLLSPIINASFSIETELFINKETKEKIDGLVEQFNNKKMVAIAPGSVWFTKRWPKNYYKKLAWELANLGYFIVLTGSKDEQSLCEEIKPSKNSVNFSGKLSILESAELIRRCKFIICNDSGALHIANAVKTKVYTFFGPTVKKIGYAPFRKNDHVFETELKCRPCGSHGGKNCPEKHHNCMRKITPELVLAKIQKDFKNNE